MPVTKLRCSSINTVAWIEDDDETRDDDRKSLFWSLCITGCIIGALLVGIILAVVLTFLLTPISTKINSTSTSTSTVVNTATTTASTIVSTTATTIPIFSTTITASTTAVTLATTIPQANWLVNGDAENGSCESSSGVTPPTGWNYNGTITQIFYNNTSGDQMYTDPGPSNRGNCYFYGQISTITSMWQIVNMTASINPLFIDNQTVWFNFSAWIGGYQEQDDNAQVSLTFRDQVNQKVGNTTTLGPVLGVDRGNITSLLFRQARRLVPVGARSFMVTVTITHSIGAYNDGDIDNIAVVLFQ